MERLANLYSTWRKQDAAKIEKLAASGSNREYYRIYDNDGSTYIGVVGTSREENEAFVYLSQHFKKRMLPVPDILAVSSDEMCYIQSDLGNKSLFDELRGGRESGGRYNVRERELLEKTIRELPNIQIRGARGLQWEHCYPQPEFNEDNVMFDLNPHVHERPDGRKV